MLAFLNSRYFKILSSREKIRYLFDYYKLYFGAGVSSIRVTMSYILFRIYSHWLILIFCFFAFLITLNLSFEIEPYNQILSSFFINLSSAFLFAFVAIIIIDSYSEYLKFLEWSSTRRMILDEIGNIIKMSLSTIEIAFDKNPTLAVRESNPFHDYQKQVKAGIENYKNYIRPFMNSEYKKLKKNKYDFLKKKFQRIDKDILNIINTFNDKIPAKIFSKLLYLSKRTQYVIDGIDLIDKGIPSNNPFEKERNFGVLITRYNLSLFCEKLEEISYLVWKESDSKRTIYNLK